MTEQVSDRAALREIIDQPMALAATKEMPVLDRHCRRFIELSPFLCLSSMSAAGNADVSPRGDPPGFVKVLDEKTILIPDRRGNRRLDTMQNILEQPSVAAIFFVPGIEETLRINGRASLTRDADLLADMAVQGQAPALGIKIEIDTVFFHCAKALKRSRLWDGDAQIDRGDFPRYGQIIKDQRNPGGTADEIEDYIQTNYKKEMY
ncbi:MAG TPA: pyridoxamine 5'-phosphate oxidase family protein [Alphaproteobacteria bacterium]|nr:pyridoxamine 5'-phosphate oxidase family protein [Alphaproteobacteria bacterium]